MSFEFVGVPILTAQPVSPDPNLPAPPLHPSPAQRAHSAGPWYWRVLAPWPPCSSSKFITMSTNFSISPFQRDFIVHTHLDPRRQEDEKMTMHLASGTTKAHR